MFVVALRRHVPLQARIAGRHPMDVVAFSTADPVLSQTRVAVVRRARAFVDARRRPAQPSAKTVVRFPMVALARSVAVIAPTMIPAAAAVRISVAPRRAFQPPVRLKAQIAAPFPMVVVARSPVATLAPRIQPVEAAVPRTYVAVHQPPVRRKARTVAIFQTAVVER